MSAPHSRAMADMSAADALALLLVLDLSALPPRKLGRALQHWRKVARRVAAAAEATDAARLGCNVTRLREPPAPLTPAKRQAALVAEALTEMVRRAVAVAEADGLDCGQ